MERLRVAVVGAGYWGPNLIRNFRSSPDWDLVAVCDHVESRAVAARGPRSTVDVETSLDRLLARNDIDAVAIATPARTHLAIALQALKSGRHVLVEKPLAESRADAMKIAVAAAERDLTLMCDHTYCYTPVVQRISELIRDGVVGDVHFIDSVRINLGLIQRDVDVLWDLAPHDLSILDAILPGGFAPLSVSAHGADPIGAGLACVGYLTMPLANGGIVHVHVNWLSPTKIRQMVIGGSRRMLVWDDLHPQQRLSVYDRGVNLESTDDMAQRRDSVISYRLGDMQAPAIPEREALGAMVAEFAAAIREGRPPRTDGLAGLRVLTVLEAASHSLAAGGVLVPVPETRLGPVADLSEVSP
ncbi:MAG: Gfo/Idh/MocA family oxidoreductase [Actinobacteria bacterium]|nr:Gfo/Idh/MocA family oxidoreductase [Actinomycetota bacterium]